MTVKQRQHNANITPGAVRHEMLDGRPHLVAPVVMIVEGVLNNALLLESEFSQFVESWNGRPVPVLHPMKNGVHVSANQPDVVERNIIGQVYNASAGGGKLRGELWIDTEKANRLGHGDIVASIEAGEIVEVSTGYQCTEVKQAGIHNGRKYTHIDTNIRPDHLALLPNEEGACSVADGCGTRVNTSKGFKVRLNEAFKVIAQGLGMRTNCSCNEETEMTVEQKLKAQAEKLKANGKLTAEQIETIMGLDAEQLDTVGALTFALLETGGGQDPSDDGAVMEDEDMPVDDGNAPAVNKQRKAAPVVNEEQLEKLVANRVQEQIERAEVTRKLVANEKCPFTEDEMQGMSVNHLKKLEASIRPADFTGQGGFATNAAETQEDYQPLTVHSGITARKKEA